MGILAIIELMRPKQWIKNFFVFAAAIFSGNIFNINILEINILTFILFCLASSSVYVLNDIVDIEKDRCHPQKKNRPLPSGKVSRKTAAIVDVILLCIVIFSSIKHVSNKLMLVLLIYIIINIFYCFKLKNIVIIDVMIISFGFLLRVKGGSYATNVDVSPWLFLCTILLSLFLALNKRKSEITTLKDKSGSHRKILEEYSTDLIDKMLSIVTPSILISYCLYTFSSIQSKTMIYTIPFVLYGIFRYQYLMEKQNIGGKPEDVFGNDRPFLINILLWISSVFIIIYLTL